MQTVELEAKLREITTRNALRLLRDSGEVPAVVYGGKKGPHPASVNAKKMTEILKSQGTNVVFSLKLGKDSETVLLKDLQRDPISRKIVHVDFQRISLTEKIEVNVPIHVKGEAPGVKLSGGILEHIQREVRVRCLPTAIPSAVEVDVSGLQINQGLKMKDVKFPEGLEVLSDPELIVVNIVAPTEFKEETPAAAAAAVPGATEPEVIAKGKKPEEGAEGAAPAAPGKEGAAKAPAAPAAKSPAGKEGK
ncbi:MAG TPA: 50S ribosomal protein L25 [Elusimicrobiota bacterium]|nr:50S ribosomal protein L25 [Elusimicrobiota bacterium]